MVSMTNPEAAIGTSHDQSIKMTRSDSNDNVPTFTWEVALNNKIVLRSGEVAARANDEPNVEQKICLTEKHATNDEDVIGKEVKSAMKYLVVNEFLIRN